MLWSAKMQILKHIIFKDFTAKVQNRFRRLGTCLFIQDLLKQNPSSWQEISLVCYFFFTLMLLQLCKVSTGFSSCLLCTKNTQKLLQILNAVNTNEVSKKIIQLARVHFVLLYPSGIR